MNPIKIGKYIIGEGQPVFIIAEIGSNYNGNLAVARQMIQLAKEAGVNAVKFQIFKEKGLYPANAGKVDYLNCETQINDIVKKAEVPDEYHKELQKMCTEEEVLYLCTPTDENCADYLDFLGVPAFKVASYEITNIPLLRHIAKKGKPMLISTGASDMGEITKAVKVIREQGNDNIIIMQCVAKYPAELEYTNLRVMDTFRSAFNVPVGLSDHSFDPYIAPFAAVAQRANVIEKHFTLNRNQEGPDHSFAVEPDELSKMVKGIREIEKAFGTSEKKVLPAEKELKSFTLSSIFAIRNIEKGATINSEDVKILRPGKKTRGLDSEYYDLVVGTRAQKEIESDRAIQWDDILVKEQNLKENHSEESNYKEDNFKKNSHNTKDVESIRGWHMDKTSIDTPETSKLIPFQKELDETKVKQFWDEQAQKHKDDLTATTPDKVYKELEMVNLLKYLPDFGTVMDVGCGNGYSTLRFAEEKPGLRLLGTDYSEGMIQYAQTNLSKCPHLSGRVKFKVADVKELSNSIPESFDIIVTERCLINLSSFEQQKQAIIEIHNRLKKGGKFIMCENTIQGMAKMNFLRKAVDLYEVPIRWHNLYFDENLLHPFLETLFEIEEIDPFASTYYLTSRVFNAKLTPPGQEPSFDSEINKLSLKLPNIGDFCPVRIYVLKKKEGINDQM